MDTLCRFVSKDEIWHVSNFCTTCEKTSFVCFIFSMDTFGSLKVNPSLFPPIIRNKIFSLKAPELTIIRNQELLPDPSFHSESNVVPDVDTGVQNWSVKYKV